MTDRSPAAQAILDAAFAVEDEWDTIPMIAAALRAAADQVLPLYTCSLGSTRGTTRLSVRLKFLAIADELEAQ